MPDITMCHGVKDETGEHCPLKAWCHRFSATPDKYLQSYFVEAPFHKKECKHFWPVSTRTKEKA